MSKEIKQKADELVELFVQYTPAEKPFEYEYAVKIAILHQKRLIEVLEKREQVHSLYAHTIGVDKEIEEQKAILTELQNRL